MKSSHHGYLKKTCFEQFTRFSKFNPGDGDLRCSLVSTKNYNIVPRNMKTNLKKV